MTATWGETDSDEEQERNSSNCFLADNEVTSLSKYSKDKLIQLVKEFCACVDAQNEVLDNQKEEIEQGVQAFNDMQDECNKWAKKATRLTSRVADVPTRDTGLESENLKLKQEISMLKTENLKLANDLQTTNDILDEKDLLICDLKEENRELADNKVRSLSKLSKSDLIQMISVDA